MSDEARNFADHFSALAAQYASWRPHYPVALYDAIALQLPPPPIRVWEPGCGSGQASLDLAGRFGHVFATDPSAAQVDAHPARGRAQGGIVLAVEPAETCSLPDASVQLIAVGQALHWFDCAAFFAQCQRVLASGGVLAAWCYQDFRPPPRIAQAIAGFRASIEPHWPPQRVDVDRGYAGYPWPFDALPGAALEMTADWTLPHLLGYLSSLSATAAAARADGIDPVGRHSRALAEAWGDPAATQRIAWPVQLILRKAP